MIVTIFFFVNVASSFMSKMSNIPKHFFSIPIWLNAHLARLCKEKNFSLVGHAKRIKPINRSKFHLNRHVSNILQDF